MRDERSVRRATRCDVDALVALRAEMFAAMGSEVTYNWQAEARCWFTERMENPDYGFFVVEDRGQVVAGAIGAVRDAAPSPSVPQGRDVLISNVCTLTAHRGRGFGRLAFEAAMEWARRTGMGRAELTATEAGRGMYERAGFVETHYPAMRATLTA